MHQKMTYLNSIWGGSGKICQDLPGRPQRDLRPFTNKRLRMERKIFGVIKIELKEAINLECMDSAPRILKKRGTHCLNDRKKPL